MTFGSNLLTLLPSSFHLRHFTVPLFARYSRHRIAYFSSAAVSHARLHFDFIPRKPVFWSRVASQVHTEAAFREECSKALTSFPVSSDSHPWPEWTKLTALLAEKGYSDHCISSSEDDDSFLVDKDLPEEFLKDANACLGFARDRPDILRLLTKKNIEVVVLNASPFLFKNGENSARRMKLFFSGEGSSEQEHEKAQTIDIMRYILSYIYDPLSNVNDLKFSELVERSVRKLLSEFFNLSGTVWKTKSIDSILTEVSPSTENFRPPGQCTEMGSGNLIYPKFPTQTSVPSENHFSATCNLINADSEKNMAYQKQGPEVNPSESSSGYGYNIASSGMNMNQTYSLNNLNTNYNEHAAESSSGLLDKDIESRSRTQANNTFNTDSAVVPSTESNQPPCHLGNSYNHYSEYVGKPNKPSGGLWTNNSPSYDGSTSNSSMLHGNSWSHQLTSNSMQSVNSTPPSRNSHYGGPTTTSSPSPDTFCSEEYRASYGRCDIDSTQPTINSGSNMTYGAQTAASSQPYSNSWDINNAPYAVQCSDSTQPSSSPLRSNNNAFYGGTMMNSSHPSRNSYDTSYGGKSSNSYEPTNNSLADNNRSYGGSTLYSSHPSFNDHQSNYYSPYEGHIAKSTQTSSISGISGNDRFIENSMHPSSRSSNGSNTSYASSRQSSDQPLPDSWNNNTAFAMKSTQPSSNSWSNGDASFHGPASNSSQQPTNSWNNHMANINPRSWNSNSSYVGSTTNASRECSANSPRPSHNSWSSDVASYNGGTVSPAQTSDRSSWSNARGSWSGGSTAESSVTEGLPMQVQSLNARDNTSYGYSGKSLEGSCVKEPDPLDMSEEAKAERWFRRAAQIKDISELSQIPDEDFPQIMPMRKGVNRFVVSKRKTPLERRLASQQYKRNFPVVSSEPDKEPTVGDSDA